MLKGTKSDDLYLPYMLLPTNGNVKKQLLEVIMYLLKCSKGQSQLSHELYLLYMLLPTNGNFKKQLLEVIMYLLKCSKAT
jgi:hypothetical protein